MPEIGAHRNGDHAGVCRVVEVLFHQGEDVEHEDDSDNDHEGILKPVFAVDEDPDFESGELLDGFPIPSACQVGS